MSDLTPERPGITLEIKMLEEGWTYLAFCQSTSIPIKYLRQLIDGEMPIDKAIDDSLCKVFKQPIGTWLTIQTEYLAYEVDKFDGQSIEVNSKPVKPVETISTKSIQCHCKLIRIDQRQHNHPWSCIEALKIKHTQLEDKILSLNKKILALKGLI